MIRKLIIGITVLVATAGFSAAPTVLAFNPFGDACSGGGGDSAVCQEQTKNKDNPLTGSKGLFVGISNIIAIAAGLSAIIVIVLAGMKYVTAGGDAAKAKSAQGTIVFALIGLVIIALAASIINFVLGRL